MQFKVLPKVGSHSDGRQTYRSGEVVESDVDLAALFPNKFEKLQEIRPVRRMDDEVVGPPVEAMGPAPAKRPPGRPKDVTKEFPLAAEKELRVTKSGSHYTVVEIDRPQVNLFESDDAAAVQSWMEGL
jgi:hypothetical protein